jgi:hypothetical protein
VIGRSGLPHLADATDLERWADRVDARYQLAHLLRRLVRHENDQEYDKELASARIAAVRDILDGEGLPVLVDLAGEVELPWAVGVSLAEITDLDSDANVVELLDASSDRIQQFASAFVNRRAVADAGWVERWVSQCSDARRSKPACF